MAYKLNLLQIFLTNNLGLDGRVNLTDQNNKEVTKYIYLYI